MISIRMWSFGYLSVWLFLTTEAHVIGGEKGYETLRFEKDQATENDREESADYLVVIQAVEDGKKKMFSYAYTGKQRDFLPPAVNSVESIEEMVHAMQLEYGDIDYDENSFHEEETEYDGEELIDMLDNRENGNDGWNMDHSDGNEQDTGKMLHSGGNALDAENLFVSEGYGRDAENMLHSGGTGRDAENMLHNGGKGLDAGNMLHSGENGQDAENMLHREKRESDGKLQYHGRSRKCNMAWRRARKALESCGVEMKTISTRDETKESEEAAEDTNADILTGNDKSEENKEDETSEEGNETKDDAAGNGKEDAKDDPNKTYTEVPQRQ